MLRDIIELPDPRLARRSAEVPTIDAELRRLVDDMVETMYAADGVGLAAIQIAVPLRVFVVEPQRARVSEKEGWLCFINPVIEWRSDELETLDEGCLSVARVPVMVKRAARLRLRAADLDGSERVVEAEGFYARVLQHEYDHLEGRTVFDHAGPAKRQLIRKRMQKKKPDDDR